MVRSLADGKCRKPRVPVLLSVADTIRLEIDFDLLRLALANAVMGLHCCVDLYYRINAEVTS
jgi:hypothetical protein